MVKERYSLFQLIPDRNKLNTGSQGFSLSERESRKREREHSEVRSTVRKRESTVRERERAPHDPARDLSVPRQPTLECQCSLP